MTFLRTAFFPRVTQADVEELSGLVPSTSPPGRLLFAAGPARGGWQVVQVWTSKELLETFNRDVLRPALARLDRSSEVWTPAEVVDFEPAQLSLDGPSWLGPD